MFYISVIAAFNERGYQCSDASSNVAA